MEKPRHLLVVIDPTANDHPALSRARMLALAFGARVELFVCYVTDAGTGVRVDERVLEKLANGLRQHGIETTTEETSAATIHAGILDKVLRTRPSLVIKDTHPHSLLRRTVVANTDWQLMRQCPAPLLFVHPGEWASAPRIAAAVDVALPGEKPAALDHVLLSAAETFALATHGQLHAVHAYQPVSDLAAAVTAAAVPMAAGVDPGRIVTDGETLARGQFEELLASHRVSPERSRLLAGAPAQALVDYVRSTAIDLLVMGAFSRGWMYNVFVGSTTERILDLLPCDVLVMKSERFECPVRPSKDREARV